MAEQQDINQNTTPDNSNALVRRELLSIFQNDDDESEHDVLHMNDIFERMTAALTVQMKARETSSPIDVTPELEAQIATFLNGMQKLNNEVMLVADFPALPRRIKQGLRNKEYHLGKSNKVKGDAWAVVLDKDNHVVAQITLKEIKRDACLLPDVAMLSMQAALQQISDQLENIAQGIDYMIDFERAQDFQKPFRNAMSKVKEAASCDTEERIRGAIREALSYLLDGMNGLYTDLDNNINALANADGDKKASLSYIDKLIVFICKDLNLIPKYLILRMYLLNCTGEYQQMSDVFDEYRKEISWITNGTVGSKRLHPYQYIHKYFDYSKENVNAWPEQMPGINRKLQAIDIKAALDQPTVYKLDVVEDDEDVE